MTSGTSRGLAGVGAAIALACLSACTTPVGDKVILLPQRDGSPSAVEVRVGAGGQAVRLDKPYATAELRSGALVAGRTDAEAVRSAYGSVLAQVPTQPQRFTVQFEANGNRLAAGSDAVLDAMRQALATLPAAEVIVTGHTDRVGTVESNDRLSLTRAEVVRELLVSTGLARTAITVAGRGEREPAVPTADEVAEPRNRRVEIKIR